MRDTLAEIYSDTCHHRAVMALALRMDGPTTRDRNLVLRFVFTTLGPSLYGCITVTVRRVEVSNPPPH